MGRSRVLFIDRDGVINSVVKDKFGNYDSPQSVREVSMVPDIESIIGFCNTNNIKVVEITNQPSVAKGKMTMKTSEAIERRIDLFLKKKGVKIDHKYICYHHPNGVIPELTMNCSCRKPKAGLITRAACELDIDLKNSVFLGDRDWDVIAGKSAGCRTMIFLFEDDNPEKIKYAKDSLADYQVRSLMDALTIIKSLY